MRHFTSSSAMRMCKIQLISEKTTHKKTNSFLFRVKYCLVPEVTESSTLVPVFLKSTLIFIDILINILNGPYHYIGG